MGIESTKAVALSKKGSSIKITDICSNNKSIKTFKKSLITKTVENNLKLNNKKNFKTLSHEKEANLFCKKPLLNKRYFLSNPSTLKTKRISNYNLGYSSLSKKSKFKINSWARILKETRLVCESKKLQKHKDLNVVYSSTKNSSQKKDSNVYEKNISTDGSNKKNKIETLIISEIPILKSSSDTNCEKSRIEIKNLILNVETLDENSITVDNIKLDQKSNKAIFDDQNALEKMRFNISESHFNKKNSQLDLLAQLTENASNDKLVNVRSLDNITSSHKDAHTFEDYRNEYIQNSAINTGNADFSLFKLNHNTSEKLEKNQRMDLKKSYNMSSCPTSTSINKKNVMLPKIISNRKQNYYRDVSPPGYAWQEANESDSFFYKKEKNNLKPPIDDVLPNRTQSNIYYKNPNCNIHHQPYVAEYLKKYSKRCSIKNNELSTSSTNVSSCCGEINRNSEIGHLKNTNNMQPSILQDFGNKSEYSGFNKFSQSSIEYSGDTTETDDDLQDFLVEWYRGHKHKKIIKKFVDINYKHKKKNQEPFNDTKNSLSIDKNRYNFTNGNENINNRIKRKSDDMEHNSNMYRNLYLHSPEKIEEWQYNRYQQTNNENYYSYYDKNAIFGVRTRPNHKLSAIRYEMP
ncbi:hypothetical protein BB561_005493 [Smittium simulii]|uniref:Uncharacterized protein n=1 Tax=Smittium simulii TaxID=133385 RepID=A0A2T9YA69_9FUNG|nr:hypothetical protein BB561_005493 [Smittium simulii]